MTAPAPATSPSQDAMSVLLGLIQRVRRATSAEEVGFIIVNETIMLVPYRQALLWRRGSGVATASGVSVLDPNGPFILWADQLCHSLAEDLAGPRKLTSQDVAPRLSEDWPEWLPAHVLAVPLIAPEGEPLGLLLFGREVPWSEAETLFVTEACETYALAWAYHLRPNAFQELRQRWSKIPRRRWLTALAVLAVMLFPVRLSVLAPGEVTGRDPAVLRSPLEGVVEHVDVQPNQKVEAGQLLFELDKYGITIS